MNDVGHFGSTSPPTTWARFEIPALLIWTGLIVGTIVGVRIPLFGGGRDVNVAVFDLVVLLAFAYVVLTRRIALSALPLRLFAGLGLAALAVVGHALITYRYGAWTPIPRLEGPIDVPALLRETLKLVTIPIELLMVMVIFSVPEFRKPQPLLLAILGLIIAGNLIYDRIQFLHDNIPYLANIAAHSLMGVAILAIATAPWRGPTRDLMAIGWIVAVTAVFVIGFRKTYLLVCIAILIMFVVPLAVDTVRQGNARARRQLVLSIVAVLLALVGLHSVMTFEFYIGRDPFDFLVATGTHSSEVRFNIQIVAWHLAVAAFPMGIGVGQFGALLPRIPEIADWDVLYIHNTPLSLAAEMGLLGIVLCAGFFYLILRACQGGDLKSRLARLVYFVLPMMFNDTHGLRMTILLLAFFTVAGSAVDGYRSAPK